MSALFRAFALIAFALASIPAQAQRITGAPAIASPTSPTPYLGPVATAVTTPNSALASGTATWSMSRSAHVMRETVSSLTLIFANWSLPTTYVENVMAGGTVKASVETADGTITQCAGGAAVSAVNGFYSLTCPVSLVSGQRIFVRAFSQNASNGLPYWNANVLNTFASDEGFIYGTGAASDLTAGGTVAAAYQRRQLYGPIAILGQTAKRTFLFFGTSKEKGIADQKTDLSGDLGTTGRLFGRSAAYIDVSVASSLLSAYMAASHPYLDALAAYVSDIVDMHGVNDIQSGGDSAATLTSRRAAFAARAIFVGKRIIGGTLSPYPSYTNGVSVSIGSLTRSGTTATATVSSTASLTTGQTVNVVGVTGASNADYNGPKVITVVNGTAFSYAVDSTVSATAPGTITYNDAWSTTAAQNVTGTNSTTIAAFNTIARAGIAGEHQLLDLASFEDPYRTLKWPVSLDPSASTGTPALATSDGLHERAWMLELTRDRGAGRVAQLSAW